MSVWTEFHDMHSGGGLKIAPYGRIYIEVPEAEARRIFEATFGREPDHVTCHCCGPDYSVDESVSLAQASGFERGCRSLETPRLSDGRFDNNRPDPAFHEHYYLEEGEEPPPGYAVSSYKPYRKYQTLAEYMKREDVKVIPASEIRPEWRR